MKPICVLRFAAALAAPLSVASAYAQEGSEPASKSAQIDEIVVTANRREENLQKVPIAVEAFTADTLKQQNVTGTDELVHLVPGLTFTQTGNYGTPFLRGVGNSATGPDAEPSVAVYVDGVYHQAETGNIFSFNNIERVEVLKGPQGTLFGRNATGGVIQIITRDPEQTPHVDVEAGYGNFNTVTGSLYATGGITPDLAADISVQGMDQRGGWGRDYTNGVPTYEGSNFSVRTKWLWTPFDALRVTLAADYLYIQGGNGYLWHLFPGSKALTGQTTSYLGFYDSVDDYHGGADPIHDDDGGASLKIEYDLGWARLMSITAGRKDQAHDGLDETATGGDLILPYILAGSDTYTQELQLLSQSDSKINWVVGAFLYKNEPSLHIFVNGAFIPAETQIIGNEIEKSAAGYAQATGEVLKDTHLTIGVRYTTQHNSVDGYTAVPGLIIPGTEGDQSGSFNRVTHRIALDHQFTPDILGYVSNNTGFKSGFFNLNTPAGPPLRPETLNAFEVGVKSELFGSRLRVNSSAFYYDYKEIQVNAITNGSEFFYNGAAAKLYGLDADLAVAVTERLSLTGGFAVIHGYYSSFPNAISYVPNGIAGNASVPIDATGNPTVRTPRFSGSIGGNYSQPVGAGKIDFNLNWAYSSTYTWDPNARLEQPVTNLVNASAVWSPNKTWDVRLWGKNILDRKYYAFAGSESVGDVYSPAPPATYGFTVGAHF